MLRRISVQESINCRNKLIKRISEALLDVDLTKSEYPKHTQLYNTLNHIMKLWEDK